MRHWEINGNLDDEHTGIENYAIFENGVCKVKDLYDQVFGSDIMNRIDFYVDNATKDSGYTPICTPVLGKLFVIKLGIHPQDSEERIVYQFAHELMHCVFYAYFGINRIRGTDWEEVVCSAASLAALKMLCPEAFLRYKEHVEKLENSAYRQGATLAAELNYDMKRIRAKIEASIT